MVESELLSSAIAGKGIQPLNGLEKVGVGGRRIVSLHEILERVGVEEGVFGIVGRVKGMLHDVIHFVLGRDVIVETRDATVGVVLIKIEVIRGFLLPDVRIFVFVDAVDEHRKGIGEGFDAGEGGLSHDFAEFLREAIGSAIVAIAIDADSRSGSRGFRVDEGSGGAEASDGGHIVTSIAFLEIGVVDGSEAEGESKVAGVIGNRGVARIFAREIRGGLVSAVFVCTCYFLHVITSSLIICLHCIVWYRKNICIFL